MTSPDVTVVFRRPKVGQKFLQRYRITEVEALRGFLPGHYRVTVGTGRRFLVRVERPPQAPPIDVGRGLRAQGDGPPVEPLAELPDPYAPASPAAAAAPAAGPRRIRPGDPRR